eukprot:403349210
MDLFVKSRGPLALAHFLQPWSQRFNNFDIFFDTFSNCMIFYKEGFFMIWDQYDNLNNQGKTPFTLHLTTIYKQIYACCVHPEKTCISLQTQDNTLILLFLRERAAEEIKLTFSKAKMIYAFSFLFGDEFNYYVATNISIDLYKIRSDKNKAKVVKSIQIQISGEPHFLYEPMSNVVLICDNKGSCHPFFLNLYKTKQSKGKPIQLDIGSTPLEQPINDNINNPHSTFTGNTGLQSSSSISQNSSYTNTQAAGFSSSSSRSNLNQNPNLTSSQTNRASFSERAINYFKKGLIGGSQKFTIAPNMYNKNLKQLIQAGMQMQQQQHQQNINDQSINQDLQDTKNQISILNKKCQHQLLLSQIYNKIMLVHLNPFTSQIQLYEIDPDSLLVLHNIDDKSSQVYDMKLNDYHVPLLNDNLEVNTRPARKGFYLTDMIYAEERMQYDETVRPFNRDSENLEYPHPQHQNEAAQSITGNKNHNSSHTPMRTNSMSSALMSDAPGIMQSKEYIEFNLQLQYTGSDDENPVKVFLDIPVDESKAQQERELQHEEEDHSSQSSKRSGDSDQKRHNNDEGDKREFDIYEEGIVFVDPLIIIDPKNHSCFSLKMQLTRMVRQGPDQCRIVLSLLNRSRNRNIFLRHFRDMMVKQQVNLIEISKIFMRINSVYNDNPLMHGHHTDLLLVQQQRLGRLRANTSSLTNTQLNGLLVEHSPSNRVLSGEAIIFQNEMLDIFKDLINNSTHPIFSNDHSRFNQSQSNQKIHKDSVRQIKPRFVVSIILEFLRTLLENQIPQQPSQQHLLVRYILATQDYQNLHCLLQYHVLADSLELGRILVNIGSTQKHLYRSGGTISNNTSVKTNENQTPNSVQSQPGSATERQINQNINNNNTTSANNSRHNSQVQERESLNSKNSSSNKSSSENTNSIDNYNANGSSQVSNGLGSSASQNGIIKITLHYPPAFQLGLDMLKKLKSYEDISLALLNENQIQRALDILQETVGSSTQTGLKFSTFMKQVQRLVRDGQYAKADIIKLRLLEMKRLDELRSKSERDYKKIFVSED